MPSWLWWVLIVGGWFVLLVPTGLLPVEQLHSLMRFVVQDL